ncbi:MAG: triose-phosphate isomerase [Candidatus Marinimicrobia bacterium]|nr:triose-phosphate isomerase [Candidatus Neomarinimicrobiota bacterium]|tara:strand:- start:838 stop:1608 length:771 start_codon:yes stop_codon:yes gene_type:complete
MIKPVVVANWKMFKTPSESVEFVDRLKNKILDWERVKIILCAPYTSLFEMGNSLMGDGRIDLGAQNIHWESEGAFTGEISAAMLQACGVEWVIVGHSERRVLFGESDEDVCRKVMTAIEEGLSVIFCVGETIQERKAGKTSLVLGEQLGTLLAKLTEDQLRKLLIAYEPIWAIGTGLNATSEQIAETHHILRRIIEKTFPSAASQVAIQYGGSVNQGNCKELSEVSEVNGFLIGGASLDVDQFGEIVKTITEVKNR